MGSNSDSSESDGQESKRYNTSFKKASEEDTRLYVVEEECLINLGEKEGDNDDFNSEDNGINIERLFFILRPKSLQKTNQIVKKMRMKKKLKEITVKSQTMIVTV